MSIRVTTPESDQCASPDCDVEFKLPNAVAGSYCSPACRDRHKGQRFLDHLRQDHRICSSCWRPRKEVETPTAETRRTLDPITEQSLVGYEYPTEHVEEGDHGLECTCGAVSHDTPNWDRREEGPYLWWLQQYVRQTRAEGQHDKQLDLPTLADTLWETGDLALALGRALSDL